LNKFKPYHPNKNKISIDEQTFEGEKEKKKCLLLGHP